MPARIVFIGTRKDEAVAITVDQGVTDISNRTVSGRTLETLHRDGEPVFVNLNNVLYVIDVEDGGGEAFIV